MASGRGKGCSPEIAFAIVNLLLADSGVGGHLAAVMAPRPPAPAPVKISKKVPFRRRQRKLTPAIVEYLHANRGLLMPDLLAGLQSVFGIRLSLATIYKEWRKAA